MSAKEFPAPFTRATARLLIGPVNHADAPSLPVGGLAGDYNPKELQVDKSMPWAKHSYTNKNGDTAKNERGNLHLEFTGAEGRTMSIELMFDGYEDNVSVADKVAMLESLTSVIDPKSDDENKRHPPLCVVAWGQQGLPSFKCVIESLSTKYTMFSSDGVPLRATCTLKLKEADTLTTKDAEVDEKNGTTSKKSKSSKTGGK
jgi:hypothetical protein